MCCGYLSGVICRDLTRDIMIEVLVVAARRLLRYGPSPLSAPRAGLGTGLATSTGKDGAGGTMSVCTMVKDNPMSGWADAFDPLRADFSRVCTPVGHAPGEGDDPGGPGDGDGSDTGLITKTRTKTKKPSLYKVLLLNDDYTPQEFVVFVLERFFNKGLEDATRIMLHVHHKGVGICGVYTFEIAETKVAQVMDFARQHQHPLQCTMEKE